MSEFNERDYQAAARLAVFEKWKKVRSTLLVMATGLGKTHCAAHIIKQVQPGRVMFLAHRNELITQARDKIKAVTGLAVEVEKASQFASTSLFHRMPVVVSSIQTQISGPKDRRRYLRFKPEEFALLICDEAHHSVSASWREVIAHYMKNPELKVLGLTATPKRTDDEALGQIFESVAYKYGISEAIADGWLVLPTQQCVTVSSLDFSHVRTTAGDLNEGDLSKVMELEENIQGVCQPSLEVMFGLPFKSLSTVPVPQWRDYLKSLNRPPKRTIIFTVSVAQAEMCANVFSRAMDGVEWVCGKTNKKKRLDILGRFASGETHAVAQCGVLLEGFDNPSVELIVMARPTKSETIYIQAVGRSTRTLPGLVDGLATAQERLAAIAASPKATSRVLDFVGVSGRHKLITSVDIFGGNYSDEVKELAKQKLIREGKPLKIMVTMKNIETELEWKRKQEAAEKSRQEEEARKRRLLAKVKFNTRDVDPFRQSDSKIPMTTVFSRDGKAFSKNQCAVFRSEGYDPSKFAYDQGRAILAKIFSRASKRQANLLAKFGYSTQEIAAFTRKTATQEIDKIAANGWRRPKP